MFRYRVVSGARRLFGADWLFAVCGGGVRWFGSADRMIQDGNCLRVRTGDSLPVESR